MDISTLTSKNQTTIPKAVVEALGLSLSSKIIYDIDDEGKVTLSAKMKMFAGLVDAFPKKVSRSYGLEEMDEAVEEMAVEKFKRSSK
jgi:antitoxin PrlF